MIVRSKLVAVLTWIGEFRPGNKTIRVVLGEESDLLSPEIYLLSLGRVFSGKACLMKIRENSLIMFFGHNFLP